MVTTVAGSDRSGAGLFEIRNGPALQALFNRPVGLALDLYGDLYVIELYAVRRLSPSGWVSTVAGDNRSGSRDGPGKQAQFDDLTDIATDDAGNVYVIDSHRGGNRLHRARRLDQKDRHGRCRHHALPGRSPSSRWGERSPRPPGLAVTGDGAVYIANTGRNQIVRLTSEGNLRAVAGTGEAGNLDGPLQAATFKLPRRIALAPGGVLVVADHMDGRPQDRSRRGRARGRSNTRWRTSNPSRAWLAYASPSSPGVVTKGWWTAPPTRPSSCSRGGWRWTTRGTWSSPTRGTAIRVSAPDGTVTTLAGGNGHGVRDGPCEEAQFARPEGVAVHVDGSIYVADSIGNRIRRISTECSVTTVAGDRPRLPGWTCR